MKFRRTLLASTLALLLPALAPAQDAKQQLNDQLYEAVRAGDAAAVRALLDRGADVNAKFRYGATALFKAAEKGNAEIVKILLDRGADVNVKDTFYSATALSWAAQKKHSAVVKALLEKGAEGAGDVLLGAVSEGDAEMVQAALAAKVAPPAGTLTAALAAASASPEKAAIAELLRKAGAQPPPEIDAATLQSYVGRYKSEQGTEVAVTAKGQLLYFAFGNPPLVMMPLDKTNFRPTDFDGLTIAFNVEGDKVTGFTLKQGANPTLFKRVEEAKQQ
jgi:hypothetical protein